MKIRRRTLLSLATATTAWALMLLLAACGSSGTPTPTATPSPTATPTPRPQLSISEGTSVQDILDQLPGNERECIRQELGDAAYDEFLQVSFATLPSPDQAEAFFTCIGQESATRLYVASAAGVSGLSDETYTCMLGVLAEYDLHDVLSGAIQQEFTMVMGTILCLNAEEAVQAGVSSLPAATTSGQASLVQMQCVASQVGVANMIGVLIQAPGTVDLPEALFTTVAECGIELLRPDRGTGFSLTGEQFQCLTAALDPTTLIELQSGVRFPNADELAIIQACGVDLTGS